MSLPNSSEERNPMSQPRPEYPRPRLVRDRWTNLNGSWDFAVDAGNTGTADHWYRTDGGGPFDEQITVPFAPQAALSGIGRAERMDTVWYRRTVDRPADAAPSDEVMLRFGAVDHQAEVWIDGQFVGRHAGGHTPFSFPVGGLLTGTDHRLVVRAHDPLARLDRSRGKQFWQPQGTGIFYTPTTGIWQTVWLEPVPQQRIESVHTSCDIGAGIVRVEVSVSDALPLETVLEAEVGLAGALVATGSVSGGGESPVRVLTLELAQQHLPTVGRQVIDSAGVALWSPETPTLYDLRLRLRTAEAAAVLDEVNSYFGMRSVEVVDGRWCLNGRAYEQRLVLDQGYWPDGLLTAPTDEQLRRDIELAKELGFNGARKHQKIEDPRWLYWADQLGLLVWGEMPSGYRYSVDLVTGLAAEFAAMIDRDRSHPCVVAWVPLNESWGVPDLRHDAGQRALLDTMYYLGHALDGSRPVISNDGWEQASTDLVTFHDYRGPDDFARDYADVGGAVTRWSAGRPRFVAGHRYSGQPLLMTEFGGLNIATSADDGWGYATCADGDELVQRYGRLLAEVRRTGVFQGFCYTQLTDVESETNGVLTADREPKVDLVKWRAITDPAHAEQLG